jgi:hypothetical protein
MPILFFSESTVVVVSVYWPENPQNTLPTMVHDQIMLIMTSQRPHREGISYQPPMLYMWVDPLEPSSEHII